MPTNETVTIEEDGDWLHLKAMWRGRRIGYVWCELEDQRLCINDIQVDDSHPIPWCCLHGLLIRLGIPCRQKSFRSQGIGTRMLQQLLIDAEARGVKEVWGCVVQSDIDETQSLLKWYEHRGFSISGRDEECRGLACIKKISKKMHGPRGADDARPERDSSSSVGYWGHLCVVNS